MWTMMTGIMMGMTGKIFRYPALQSHHFIFNRHLF